MQKLAYIIRKAVPADAGSAFAVIDEYCDEIGVIVRDSREDLDQYLSADRSGIWLAWLDASSEAGTPRNQAVIGCILLRPLTRIQGAGEIKRLYVRQAYRAFGVARALLLALEGYAAVQGIEWLYLDTKQDLKAAIQFYERSGYQRCERYNSNPQATIFMRKQLV